MFTIEQINAALSKVKSGADFPQYVQEIIKAGVTSYETYVADGHTDYYGENDYKILTSAKYAWLVIADSTNAEQFKRDLQAHQQGKTDYKTFCTDCAKSGVEKWLVNMDEMTCTYFDKQGNKMLVEINQRLKTMDLQHNHHDKIQLF